MTVVEMMARFPEIPSDLADEPVVAELGEVCDDLLCLARQPSNCSQEYEASNHYYTKLVGPMGIYGLGLDTKEKLLARLRDLIDRRNADPEGFAASLLPADVAAREVKGPDCE